MDDHKIKQLLFFFFGTSLQSSSTVVLTLTMALAKDVLEALRSKPN